MTTSQLSAGNTGLLSDGSSSGTARIQHEIFANPQSIISLFFILVVNKPNVRSLSRNCQLLYFKSNNAELMMS
jgi:hypothetical protein